MGSGARWRSIGRRCCQGVLPSVSVARRVVGHWLRFGGPKAWSVGPWHVRREAGTKTRVSLFPAAPAGGRRKGNSAVQNGTFWFFFFLLKMYETTSFWVKRAVSFKCGARNAPKIKPALQLFLFIPIASLPISVPAPIVGRVFHFGPWPLIYAI